MELQQLLKALLVVCLAALLQCGQSRAAFARGRLSADAERHYQEEGEGEFDEEDSSSYEEELKEALDKAAVRDKAYVQYVSIYIEDG